MLAAKAVFPPGPPLADPPAPPPAPATHSSAAQAGGTQRGVHGRGRMRVVLLEFVKQLSLLIDAIYEPKLTYIQYITDVNFLAIGQVVKSTACITGGGGEVPQKLFQAQVPPPP